MRTNQLSTVADKHCAKTVQERNTAAEKIYTIAFHRCWTCTSAGLVVSRVSCPNLHLELEV